MPARLRAGELEAVVVPEDGMLVAALRHRGENCLAERPDPWTGSPLLHPWANRLSAERFTVRGRTVDASGARRDENAVPMHGLPSARRGWTGDQVDAGSVRVRREWVDGAFPFRHELVVEHRLTEAGLETTADVRGVTPVAFGWRPFLRLPGEPRGRWRVTLGSRRRLILDDRLLPTVRSSRGRRLPSSWATGASTRRSRTCRAPSRSTASGGASRSSSSRGRRMGSSSPPWPSRSPASSRWPRRSTRS